MANETTIRPETSTPSVSAATIADIANRVTNVIETLLEVDDQTRAISMKELAKKADETESTVKAAIALALESGKLPYQAVRGRHGGIVHNNLAQKRADEKRANSEKSNVRKARDAVKTLQESGLDVPHELLVKAGMAAESDSDIAVGQ